MNRWNACVYWNARVLSVLLLAATGCQTQEGALGLQDSSQAAPPVNRKPIVFPNAPGARKKSAGGKLRDRRGVSKEDRGWEEKLSLARDYAAGGHDEQAIQILDVCLSQTPSEPYYGQMRALKTSLQMRRTEEKLMRADAIGVKDYVTFGDHVDVMIRLRNVTNVPVILRAPQTRGVSPTALSIEITRTDRDVYATQVQRSWTRNVFLHARGAKALTIKPGASHEIPIRIPASEVGDPIKGLRILEVGGMLRPTRLSRGKEGRTVRLRIRKGRVVVLPKNYEPVVLDPIRSMRTAVETGAGHHLLIASEFIPRRSRVTAVEILARALGEGDPSLRRAVLGALATLREHAAGARMKPLVAPLMESMKRNPRRAEAVMEGIAALCDVRRAPDPRLWDDWWERDLADDERIPAPGGRLTDSWETPDESE